MPLTSIVEYFNAHLRDFHPEARLATGACFRCSGAHVLGRLAGYRLQPWQQPVVRARTGRVVGWRGRLLVESASGRQVTPETLYVQAWDSEDVIFLDRFLRTLQALHHLSVRNEPVGLLAVDVHLRHVAALPEQHGQVFEGLLHRLGLAPGQIVLRLSAGALQADRHVRAAARSFAGRGYGLLAVHPEVATTDWELLRRLGINWVTPDAAAWRCAGQSERAAEALARCVGQARGHGIGVWFDGVDDRAALTRAVALGADLIEGAALRPAPTHRSVSDARSAAR